MSKLEHCPLCGGTDFIVVGGSADYCRFELRCKGCYNRFNGGYDGFKTEQEMIEARNTRTAPEIDRLQKENEQLRQRQKAKTIKCDEWDEQDYIRCPACNEVIGTNDDFEDVRSNFCRNCGQKLEWKQDEAETVNEFDTQATDGYHEQKKVMSSMSIDAIVRAVDYIACLSQFIGKENEVLDDMEVVLEPLKDVVEKLMTDELCPKCNGHLFRSDLPQYDYICPSCDENF